MKKRASGILVHISSLPGEYGIGDFGPEAFRFVDFLHKSRQSYWQILPLTVPNINKGFSPYNCLSAFAGNLMLISPRLLYKSGLLKKDDISDTPDFGEVRIDYKKVFRFKKKIVNKAVERFVRRCDKNEFNQFCFENKDWLDEHSVFKCLLEHYRTFDWSQWPKSVRDGRRAVINKLKGKLKSQIEKEKIIQFLFFKQWFSLKKYCNDCGVSVIGDIPLYVAYQSSDVWAHQDIFKLDKAKKPAFISGVPPDLFSKTGQLWGNPLYNWTRLKKTGYHWWMQRLRHNLQMYDLIRIDHFRGLVKYWQVPAGHKTAVKGRWVKGPGEEFFEILFKRFPAAPLILEDLGYITADVREMVQKLELAGMKVLLFAFDDFSGKNPYLPHNHIENCVVYTGTHDNNTIRGWFEKEATKTQKKVLYAYLGRKISAENLPWELIRLAMSSVARTVIIPVQDILGLGSKTRMNKPANIRGNWKWRLREGQISKQLANRLARITKFYGRA